MHGKVQDKKLQAYQTFTSAPTDMLDGLFQEKRNIAKEMAQQNERRIEVIKEKMASLGASVSVDDGRTKVFIEKNERLHLEQLKQEQANEDRKKRERAMKEKETKAFLDMQV